MKIEKTPINVLIIDDDSIVRDITRSYLKDKLNVFAVESPRLGFRILKNEKIDIIITDFMLPEMNGLEVLDKVKTEYPNIEVIMISSSDEMDIVIGALRKGAADFCKKPFTSTQLWLAIERTRKFSELQNQLNDTLKKNSQLKQEADKVLNHSIIGSSAAIESVKNQMQMVAVSPLTSVLLIGESGTGKELVARGIHNMSSRKGELFGAANMSAIPESLFESEFFGHKKGSFTGAISDKAGWFESINKGTLFFDEIGEMSMSLQVKLLRVLEDRKYTRIGTHQEKEFDIRIISATNKSVEELTNGTLFRLDLFHRIGTFIIQIPPLRDRISDIPLLVTHFMETLSKQMGKKIIRINDEVYDLLSRYSFPGNVRELKNLIERAIIMCNTDELSPKHIMLLSNQHTSSLPTSDSVLETFDLKEVERNTIERALLKVNYNKAEAARLLNIEWNALYRRIQKYNIEIPHDVASH